MSKVEFSQWRCVVPVRASETGSCDEVVIQMNLEEHLRKDHRLKPRGPQHVIEHFVLLRSSDLSRARPPRRPAVKDTTMEMFQKGVDFR